MENKFNDDIDLTQPLRKIYKSRRLIFLITSIFILIGIVISLLSPIKYSSSTIFIPQNQESSSSSLSGVASLVGINLGQSFSSNNIAPSMYPQISNSPKFKRLILQSKIDTNLNVKDYIVKYYKLDGDEVKNKNSIYVSKLEEDCFTILNDLISISVNQKDGFITINSIMPEAEYAAVLANNAKDILQKIIIQNKIESAKQNLKFSQEQLEEKKVEFDEIQNKLSYFKDSNLNLVNSLKISEQNKLNAEFTIISSVVTELSKQVEQAKLQVSKDTPVFSTIKEAVVPNIRTSPKRTKMVVSFAFAGFIISVFIVLFNKPVIDLIKKIKN